MRKTAILSALALLAVAASCVKEKEIPSSDEPYCGGPVSVPLAVDVAGSVKSSVTAPEDSIYNLRILVFSEGLLAVDKTAAPPFDNLSVPLMPGRKYRFYAFANRPIAEENDLYWDHFVDEDKHIATGLAQTEEKEMEDVRAIYEYITDLGAAGIPMSYAATSDWSFTAGEASVKKVRLPMTRLTAKYRFRLDVSALERGKVTVRNVTLKQSPWSVFPFRAESAADSDLKRDYNADDRSTPLDAETVNAGGSAVFYVLENMQGTLLGGNTDPWKKTPAYLKDGKDTLCTYLEAVCSYESYDGIKSDSLTYRMYLGKDNCTNFDIERNTVSEIILAPSDRGVFRSTWKVNMDGNEDTRTLLFANTGTTEAGLSYSDTLELTADPEWLDYSLSFSEDDVLQYGLSCEQVDSNRYVVRTAYDGQEVRQVTVRALTWDGLCGDALTLNLDNTPFTEFEVLQSDDLVTGRWSRASFPSQSEQHPIQVAGIDTRYREGQVDSSAAHCVLYYTPEDDNTIYIFPVRGGTVQNEIYASQTRRGQTATVKINTASECPKAKATDFITLLEDGREGKSVDVGLRADGRALTLDELEVPEKVAAQFGLDRESLWKKHFPDRDVVSGGCISVERNNPTDTVLMSFTVWGTARKDTTLTVGWENLSKDDCLCFIREVKFTPAADSIYRYENNQLLLNKNQIPGNEYISPWFDSGYDHAEWKVFRYADIDGRRLTDPETDLLLSCVTADSVGARPFVTLTSPEMDSVRCLTQTIDEYSAFAAGAYCLKGYMRNARTGKMTEKATYDFDVVTTVPVGTYLTSEPKIDGENPATMLDETLEIRGKIVPMEFRFHKSYALWNKAMANLLFLDMNGWNYDLQDDWGCDWWGQYITISKELVKKFIGKTFSEVCDIIYEELDAEGRFDYSLLPLYSTGPEYPRKIKDSYTIDRNEICSHPDEISYKGERGFYKFVRASAVFSELDAKSNELANVRYRNWSDLFIGYDWLYW